MQIDKKKKFILAVPKGRILKELLEIFELLGLVIEKDFFNPESRKLTFSTKFSNVKDKTDQNLEEIQIIRVRSQDIATIVSSGAADIGVCGRDILLENELSNLYIPLNLGIGKCEMVLACEKNQQDEDLSLLSHISVATKYPNLTKNYFKSRGITAQTIYLSGAVEIAPALKLSKYIVDIVSTGNTLSQNNLKVVKKITNIYSSLIINRISYKLYPQRIQNIINLFGKKIKK